MIESSTTTRAPSSPSPVPATAALGQLSNPGGSVYEQITNRIIALLRAGTVPWRKPWNAKTGWPRNLVSTKPYRGVNVLLLHAMQYQSPFWLTFRQAQELGGHIRKGEKATPVVFWKSFNSAKPGEAEPFKKPELTPEPNRRRMMARMYWVFNEFQCENLKNIPPVSTQMGTLTAPVAIVENMPKRPDIKYGLRSAFYSPPGDFVGMPSREVFSSEDAFFSTIYHELVHATGHATRLNRPTLTESQGFGSDPYCKEELIAEIGAAFLCGHAGITESTITNSAAYVQGWLGKLQNDKSLFVSAAAQAQHAADFILDMTPESPSSPEGIE
jgi:antirestriction protein ArdC